jgi:hypothetical protein
MPTSGQAGALAGRPTGAAPTPAIHLTGPAPAIDLTGEGLDSDGLGDGVPPQVSRAADVLQDWSWDELFHYNHPLLPHVTGRMFTSDGRLQDFTFLVPALRRASGVAGNTRAFLQGVVQMLGVYGFAVPCRGNLKTMIVNQHDYERYYEPDDPLVVAMAGDSHLFTHIVYIEVPAICCASLTSFGTSPKLSTRTSTSTMRYWPH